MQLTQNQDIIILSKATTSGQNNKILQTSIKINDSIEIYEDGRCYKENEGRLVKIILKILHKIFKKIAPSPLTWGGGSYDTI